MVQFFAHLVCTDYLSLNLMHDAGVDIHCVPKNITLIWSVFISMPTHNRLFSESPTFGGTQHYLQSNVKVLHFTS